MVSRKLSKPSLKNYLSTGKVIIEGSHEASDASKANVDKENADERVNIDKLLELFSPEDLVTWEPIFKAGAKIKRVKSDLAELRNYFRTMDRTRFTLYILESEKTEMRTIRSGVHIKEPFLLFLLWDDTGAATVYVIDDKTFF